MPENEKGDGEKQPFTSKDLSQVSDRRIWAKEKALEVFGIDSYSRLIELYPSLQNVLETPEFAQQFLTIFNSTPKEKRRKVLEARYSLTPATMPQAEVHEQAVLQTPLKSGGDSIASGMIHIEELSKKTGYSCAEIARKLQAAGIVTPDPNNENIGFFIVNRAQLNQIEYFRDSLEQKIEPTVQSDEKANRLIDLGRKYGISDEVLSKITPENAQKLYRDLSALGKRPPLKEIRKIYFADLLRETAQEDISSQLARAPDETEGQPARDLSMTIHAKNVGFVLENIPELTQEDLQKYPEEVIREIDKYIKDLRGVKVTGDEAKKILAQERAKDPTLILKGFQGILSRNNLAVPPAVSKRLEDRMNEIVEEAYTENTEKERQEFNKILENMVQEMLPHIDNIDLAKGQSISEEEKEAFKKRLISVYNLPPEKADIIINNWPEISKELMPYIREELAKATDINTTTYKREPLTNERKRQIIAVSLQLAAMSSPPADITSEEKREEILPSEQPEKDLSTESQERLLAWQKESEEKVNRIKGILKEINFDPEYIGLITPETAKKIETALERVPENKANNNPYLCGVVEVTLAPDILFYNKTELEKLRRELEKSDDLKIALNYVRRLSKLISPLSARIESLSAVHQGIQIISGLGDQLAHLEGLTRQLGGRIASVEESRLGQNNLEQVVYSLLNKALKEREEERREYVERLKGAK